MTRGEEGEASATLFESSRSRRGELRRVERRADGLCFTITGQPELSLSYDTIGHIELREGGLLRVYAATTSGPRLHLIRVPRLHAEDAFDAVLPTLCARSASEGRPLSILERDELRFEPACPCFPGDAGPRAQELSWDGGQLSSDAGPVGRLERHAAQPWESVLRFEPDTPGAPPLFFADGVVCDARGCVLAWFEAQGKSRLQIETSRGESWVFDPWSERFEGAASAASLAHTGAGLRLRAQDPVPLGALVLLAGLAIWWRQRPSGLEAWMAGCFSGLSSSRRMPSPSLVVLLLAWGTLPYAFAPAPKPYGGLFGPVVCAELLLAVTLCDRIGRRELRSAMLAIVLIYAVASLGFMDRSPLTSFLFALGFGLSFSLLFLISPLLERIFRPARPRPYLLSRFPPLIAWQARSLCPTSGGRPGVLP